MSTDALHWAWKQKTGSPSALVILVRLADFANQDAEAYPSIDLLAEHTEQSPQTVRRRLRELEELGLIERLPQFRNNGSRSVDLYRLCMDDDLPQRQTSPKGGPSKLEGHPLPDCEGGPSTVGRGALPTVVPPEPPYEPSYEIPPLSPPEGDGVGDAVDDGTQFEAFREAYEPATEPACSWSSARREWSRLKQAERAEALLRLPRYLDDCRTKGRKVCFPATYLREQRWAGFAVTATVASPPLAPVLDETQRAVAWARSSACRDAWVFIESGTDEWAAWGAAFRHAGYAAPGAAWAMAPDGAGGWTRRFGRSFPMPRPPRSDP